MSKKTVGAHSLELMQKTPESRSPIEIQQEMQQDYLKELVNCVETSKSTYQGDFYVVVITKNEKLMPNVFRNYFFARKTCPTPEYDQSVFMYRRADESIIYLWTVPSKDACFHLKDNALLVDSKEKELLNYVFQFFDGTLYNMSKKLNGEQEKSPLIAKG